MQNKFDELAKGLAQTVTRRAALRQFGAAIAGIGLAILGLPNKIEASASKTCNSWQCRSSYSPTIFYEYVCGSGRPKVHHNFAVCSPIGPVACSYCSNCC